MALDPNYLHRMICLSAINELGMADICHKELLPKNLLPTLTEMSKDAVPNVRFKVRVTSFCRLRVYLHGKLCTGYQTLRLFFLLK